MQEDQHCDSKLPLGEARILQELKKLTSYAKSINQLLIDYKGSTSPKAASSGTTPGLSTKELEELLGVALRSLEADAKAAKKKLI